ncbi:MAG: HAMP domain-containing histidine kinase [bacterium]|nr:HAMP domain-containing histidine kinase [bacterium]
MKKRIVYVFIIPLLLILTTIYFLNRFTKDKIKSQTEQITVAEGIAIRSLLEVSGRRLVEEGEDQMVAFMDNLYQNELIVYIGLFKENELIHLLSRFEGYFPIVEGREDLHVIDSPIGKIFDISGNFKDNNGKSFRLHIGFNYEFLSAFEETLSRNFYIVAALFAVLMLLITLLIIYFDKKFFQKELELEREKQEKDRLKELSLLTSEIAHEIKNPLNSLYLSFNALEKFLGKDKDAVFYRDAVKGEVKRITTIIESYSDLSRELHPRLEAVDIKKTAAEFQWMMEGELKKNNALLNVHLEETGVFKTDADLLKQVLLNLVKNAVEAGATVITLAVALNKKRLRLTVTDNGKGMDEETAARIFKPYMSTKTKGMGLGLHIILKILKALDGHIDLVSRTPGNTAFQIEIPEK